MTLQSFRRIGCCLTVATAITAAGCERRDRLHENPVAEAVKANRDVLNGPTSQEGRRLFAAYCATCHGDEGRGDGQNASRVSPRPPDLRKPTAARSGKELRRIVESGTGSVGRSPLCPPHARDLGPAGVEAVLRHLELLRADEADRRD